jgi:KaiC/GvpD/RAD55 family RecA-like ATPase
MLRTKTGIPGMDELVEGGFPESASILVSGGAGSGKSIFCLQYLYAGAKLYGEPGLYVTLEESTQNIWWITQRFKWDLLPLEREGKIKLFKFEPSPDFAEHVEDNLATIVSKVREMGAKRLVVDSITALSFWLEPQQMRSAVYRLIEGLRKAGCTTLLTCETLGSKSSVSRFGFEDFLADGVVQLFFMPPNRSLFIRKMRATNQSKGIHPFEITEQGVIVNAKEQVMWEAIKD